MVFMDILKCIFIKKSSPLLLGQLMPVRYFFFIASRILFEVHEIKGIFFLCKNELATFLAHFTVVYKQKPSKPKQVVVVVNLAHELYL